MPLNLAQKLIKSHLVTGEMKPSAEIGLRIDQTLTQDATGTLVMLELEAMNLDRTAADVSVQYVDHNLIQEDHKNPDDHLFLYSAAQRFGLWYSKPGNGVSHPVHQERFGIPGKTLLGSDSHTPAAGGIGMLAFGAGGLEVALAIAGEPYYLEMPEIWGVELIGKLPDWVSAKDVILEMLRRHGVSGGLGRIIEYYGPGVNSLCAMDRHVIANMGAELGATSTVFPSDKNTLRFLKAQGRGEDWQEISADQGARYDHHETINLFELEPLIAMPTSPGNVKPVREVEGQEIYQAYIGSSANPGYRDFAIVAEIVKGKQAHHRVSLDINPTSRQILTNLSRNGHLQALIEAGARIHQAGCNGCIGMGQAPATDKISLRTVPRNFPGRSGTREDKVCLVSPETAAVSALKGEITDPRKMVMIYPNMKDLDSPSLIKEMLVPPLPDDEAGKVELRKGPNIASIPELDPIPNNVKLAVILKVGDDISTDEILPAGSRVLPFRSNIPKISEFTFDIIDDNYYKSAKEAQEDGGHIVVGGENYGQGSSREHAALAPRYLGLRIVLAKSFARIHKKNLANFGILALEFEISADYDTLSKNDILEFSNLHQQIGESDSIKAENLTQGKTINFRKQLSPRQIEVLLEGGLINYMRKKLSDAPKNNRNSHKR